MKNARQMSNRDASEAGTEAALHRQAASKLHTRTVAVLPRVVLSRKNAQGPSILTTRTARGTHACTGTQ